MKFRFLRLRTVRLLWFATLTASLSAAGAGAGDSMMPGLGSAQQFGHRRPSGFPVKDWNNDPQRPQWNQNMLGSLTGWIY
jgi:hypothetical protein